MPRKPKSYRDNPPRLVEDHRVETRPHCSIDVEKERDELVRVMDRMIESMIFLRNRVAELTELRAEYGLCYGLLFDAHKALEKIYLRLF